MDYFYAFLILISFWALTTWLAAFLGELLIIGYVSLAVYFGLDYLLFGIAAFVSNSYNIYISAKYIKKHGAVSDAPMIGIRASSLYLTTFLFIIILKYLFSIDNSTIDDWYFYIFTIGLWILNRLVFGTKKNREEELNTYFESVTHYKIIEKYKDDPKWATYLYFNDGKEDWNKTIKGSHRAKDPVDDLTFVFYTKDDALEYAEFNFINAEELY